MINYFTEDIIKNILEKHPSECVFELDAPKNIAERLSGKTKNEWFERQNRDAFRACFHASEIYCPHEGINRLAECGVKSLDWELV
jgi:hypothetical protein